MMKRLIFLFVILLMFPLNVYAAEKPYTYNVSGNFPSYGKKSELIDLWDVPDSDVELSLVDTINFDLTGTMICSAYNSASLGNLTDRYDHNATMRYSLIISFYDSEQSSCGISVINSPEQNGIYKDETSFGLVFYSITYPEFKYLRSVNVPSNARYMELQTTAFVTQNPPGGSTSTFTPTTVNVRYTADIIGKTNSERTVIDAIDEQTEYMKEQDQKEVDEANKAGSSASDSTTQLTSLLSSWEIFTMPFQLLQDFVTAIESDGSTGLTFPSFSMMGFQIWPSYTFDLNTIKSSFPVLYDGLHAVTGIIVVGAFINYLWRKWSNLMGDDTPDAS